MSNSLFRLRRSRSSVSTSQQTVTTALDPLERSTSGSTTPTGGINKYKDAAGATASIGSALSVVCDSVPVLGTLTPIAAGFTEICTTVKVCSLFVLVLFY